MSSTQAFGGRPVAPPPGAAAPELLVARFRSHARRLFWSALVLIAVTGATAYFYGNLPAPLEDWMLLTAAGVVVFVAVAVPYLAWLTRSYTITTRRVVARSGLLTRRRAEFSHARGYRVVVRRGPLQRMWGAGTLTLVNGVDAPLRLANIPRAELVHETLVDQIEVNQILAHREVPTGQLPVAQTDSTQVIPPI